MRRNIPVYNLIMSDRIAGVPAFKCTASNPILPAQTFFVGHLFCPIFCPEPAYRPVVLGLDLIEQLNINGSPNQSIIHNLRRMDAKNGSKPLHETRLHALCACN